MSHVSANSKNMTKALATILNKAENPDSAQVNVSLRNGYSYSRSASYTAENYAEYCDSVRTKLYQAALYADKGRKPGSRIVEDENGEFILV